MSWFLRSAVTFRAIAVLRHRGHPQASELCTNPSQRALSPRPKGACIWGLAGDKKPPSLGLPTRQRRDSGCTRASHCLVPHCLHRVVMESAGRPRAGHLMSLCISFFFCSKRTDNSQPSEDSAEMSAASPAQPGVGRGFSKCLVRCAHSHWSAVLTRAAGVGRVRAAAGTAPAPSSRKSRAWGSGHELQSPTPLSPST